MRTETHVGHHAICTLTLSNLNENWNNREYTELDVLLCPAPLKA
jgi:hypothetical protein